MYAQKTQRTKTCFSFIRIALAVRLRNFPSLRCSIWAAVGALPGSRTYSSGPSSVGRARASTQPSLHRRMEGPASEPSSTFLPLWLRRRRRFHCCAAVGRIPPSHLRRGTAALVGRIPPSRLQYCAAASAAPPCSARAPPRLRRCASVGRKPPPHLRCCVASSAAHPPPPPLPRLRRSGPAVAPPAPRRRSFAGGDPPPLLQYRSSARDSYLLSRGFYSVPH